MDKRGHLLFLGEDEQMPSVEDVQRRMRNESRQNQSRLDEVEKVVLKALAKEPQDRFDNILQFADALEATTRQYRCRERQAAPRRQLPPSPLSGGRYNPDVDVCLPASGAPSRQTLGCKAALLIHFSGQSRPSSSSGSPLNDPNWDSPLRSLPARPRSN